MKKWLLVFGVFFLSLGVFSAFILPSRIVPEKTAPIEPTPTPFTPTMTTYSSHKFGYDFSYPNEWHFIPFNEETAIAGTFVIENYSEEQLKTFQVRGDTDWKAYAKVGIKIELSMFAIDKPFATYTDEMIKDTVQARITKVASPQQIAGRETTEVIVSYGYPKQYIANYYVNAGEKKVLIISVVINNYEEKDFWTTDDGKKINDILSSIVIK